MSLVIPFPDTACLRYYPPMFFAVVRFLVGFLLLPVCVVITRTLISLINTIQPDSGHTIPPAALALIAGFLLWQLIYFVLPRPARTYVIAHELTHALWGWLMGAKIFNIQVRKETGSVTLSKTNFLITLAPYFFPLYTVLIIIVYYILTAFLDMSGYYVIWLGLIGLTWGFHATFTISTLMQKQSDIRECGRIFSYTIIYIFNVLGIALWVILVSSASFEQMISFLMDDFFAVGRFLLEKTGIIWSKFGVSGQ